MIIKSPFVYTVSIAIYGLAERDARQMASDLDYYKRVYYGQISNTARIENRRYLYHCWLVLLWLRSEYSAGLVVLCCVELSLFLNYEVYQNLYYEVYQNLFETVKILLNIIAIVWRRMVRSFNITAIVWRRMVRSFRRTSWAQSKGSNSKHY